jgi:hypothetical protein
LVEIHGARLNSSEKLKKTQAFPFFGPSPGRNGFSRGRRGRGDGQLGDGQLGEGKGRGMEKSGDASLFLACFSVTHYVKIASDFNVKPSICG